MDVDPPVEQMSDENNRIVRPTRSRLKKRGNLTWTWCTCVGEMLQRLTVDSAGAEDQF